MGQEKIRCPVNQVGIFLGISYRLVPPFIFLRSTLMKEVADQWVSLLLWSHLWQPRVCCLPSPSETSARIIMGHEMATLGLT